MANRAKTQEEYAEQHSQLYYAIKENNADRLQELLVAGVNPNTVFEGADGIGKPLVWFPLHLSCQKGSAACCRLLLRHGARIDQQDRWGQTPLMYAVCIEWTELIALFLDHNASLHITERQGRTSLHLAVECSDERPLKMLLEAGPDVDKHEVFGRSPLWKAVSEDGNMAKAQLLLDYGANPNKADIQGNWTPLQAAIKHAKRDRLSYVKLLVKYGASVNHRDKYNHSSLYNLIARLARDTETDPFGDLIPTAEVLLAAGFDVNAVALRQVWNQFSGTILKFSVDKSAPIDIIEFLLSNNADPDIPDHNDSTPLLSASMAGRVDIVQALLRFNCRVDLAGRVEIARVPQILTPLHCAAVFGHVEIVKLLLVCGARTLPEEAEIASMDTLVCSCFIEARSRVTALTHSCRLELRACFGKDIFKHLQEMILPESVKQFILMNDVLS